MGHMGTYMVHVPLHVSGLILHGNFQTKFLGILYHKLSTFMLIRRSAACFKGPILNMWNIRKLFYHNQGTIMACMVRGFPEISLLSVGVLSNPFNWRKVLSVAKGCHLICLLI